MNTSLSPQVLVPSMLFGISFGVVLCPLSPEWVQTALLSVLLVAVTHKTFSQGVAKWRQEQRARECASAISLDALGFFTCECFVCQACYAIAGEVCIAAPHC